jgi:hypothetical protein
VTMTSGTGACSLTATWAADSNYIAATARQSATASKIAPTVTFTGAPASAAYQSGFTVATLRLHRPEEFLRMSVTSPPAFRIALRAGETNRSALTFRRL